LIENGYDSIDVGFNSYMSADGETLNYIFSGKVESYYLNHTTIVKIVGEK